MCSIKLLLVLLAALVCNASEREEIERWQRENRAREDAEAPITVSDAEMAEAEEFLKEKGEGWLPPRPKPFGPGMMSQRLVVGTVLLGLAGAWGFMKYLAKLPPPKSRGSGGACLAVPHHMPPATS